MKQFAPLMAKGSVDESFVTAPHLGESDEIPVRLCMGFKACVFFCRVSRVN